MGYGTVALRSKSKRYLFKLLEYNKVAIHEGHLFMQSNSNLEKIATKFMFCEGSAEDTNLHDVIRDSSLNTSLRNDLKNVLGQMEKQKIQIEATQAECQSVILAIIRYVDSKAKELYR
jgi:hypothetical protein